MKAIKLFGLMFRRFRSAPERRRLRIAFMKELVPTGKLARRNRGFRPAAFRALRDQGCEAVDIAVCRHRPGKRAGPKSLACQSNSFPYLASGAITADAKKRRLGREPSCQWTRNARKAVGLRQRLSLAAEHLSGPRLAPQSKTLADANAAGVRIAGGRRHGNLPRLPTRLRQKATHVEGSPASTPRSS